jgi:hypothetical protein
MNRVMEEAISIVESGFGSLAVLPVNGLDPIIGKLTLINNRVAQDTKLFVGFLLGSYNPTTQVFSAAMLNVDGIDYAVGGIAVWTTPTPGTTVSPGVGSYAPNPSAATGFDVLAFVMPFPLTIGQLFADYGSGNRPIGLKKADFDAAKASIIDAKPFIAQLQVSPAGPSIAVSAFTAIKA